VSKGCGIGVVRSLGRQVKGNKVLRGHGSQGAGSGGPVGQCDGGGEVGVGIHELV